MTTTLPLSTDPIPATRDRRPATVEILDPRADAARIAALRARGYRPVDGWDTALDELRALRELDPAVVFDERDLDATSRYIAYPWRRILVRLPDRTLFHRLRTTRNRYLITEDEQDAWSSARIAVAGLSVGGSVLHTCALTGARRFRIADPDVLGPSNLNRLAGSVCDLGTSKTVLAARRILELDPYADVEAFRDGYTAASADAFLGGPEAPRVVIEEMDDLRRKLELRVHARRAGLPVLMVTDDGDGVMVDVERFDLEPDRPLVHGRVGDLLAFDDAMLDDRARRVEIAGAIVGDDITDRMRASLAQVGRTIPSWPQLGTAATLAGAIGALVARRIVCGDPVPSGRVHIRPADLW